MKRYSPVFCAASLLLFSLLYFNVVWGATPGLPFTEDFSNTNLRDDVKTSVAWITNAGLLTLEKKQPRFGPFLSTISGSDVSADTNMTTAIALGDVDGDGDLDLFAGNNGQPNRVYLNDGFGSFTGADISADTNNTHSIAIGDLDNDGDIDFIAGNDGLNRVYLNDGFGIFTGANISAVDNNYTPSIALGDLDGDGDLDFI